MITALTCIHFTNAVVKVSKNSYISCRLALNILSLAVHTTMFKDMNNFSLVVTIEFLKYLIYTLMDNQVISNYVFRIPFFNLTELLL